MPMKQWFRKFQPVQLYTILTITVAFFLVELVVSHFTHALTLLTDSYHMLCNIMALTGCIITIKYGHKPEEAESKDSTDQSASIMDLTSDSPKSQDKKQEKLTKRRAEQERKLKNTFGWARIDVISMLICCVFLASLCFSILVEGLQTLVHIDHHDEMHHPIAVLCVGSAGLLLNGICYLLIGGFTFHQGSFLYVTESGDVVLDKVVVSSSIRKGERRLSRTRINVSPQARQRQGFWEMMRDVLGCVLVIVCAVIVYFTDTSVAKYVDPVISMVSASSLMFLSYPYMKESCLILLQTIPDSININSLHADLMKHFPDIVNVHDLHVWELSANKVVSTVHVIFQSPKVYADILKDVKEFFVEYGITQVTIQPEFYTKSPSTESLPLMNCLMKCQGENCRNNHCCPNLEEDESPNVLTIRASKEQLPSNLELNLKSVKILDNELKSSAHDLTSDQQTEGQNPETESNVEEQLNSDENAESETEAPIMKSEDGQKNEKKEEITDKTE